MCQFYFKSFNAHQIFFSRSSDLPKFQFFAYFIDSNITLKYFNYNSFFPKTKVTILIYKLWIKFFSPFQNCI
jgi:hypothetical protein